MTGFLDKKQTNATILFCSRSSEPCYIWPVPAPWKHQPHAKHFFLEDSTFHTSIAFGMKWQWPNHGVHLDEVQCRRDHWAYTGRMQQRYEQGHHICCRVESPMLQMEEMAANRIQLQLTEDGKAGIQTTCNRKDTDGMTFKHSSKWSRLDTKQHSDWIIVNIKDNPSICKRQKVYAHWEVLQHNISNSRDYGNIMQICPDWRFKCVWPECLYSRVNESIQ